MNQVKKISLRAEKKSGKANALRQNGQVPAIVYGPKHKPTAISIDKIDLQKAYEIAGRSRLIDLEIDDEAKKVLIYDLQFDPVSDEILHVDFYAVRMDQEIHTDIPLRLIGESKAVKDLGGSLLEEKDSLEIECLPQDLIDEIEIDISVLDDFDKVIKVSDLDIPSNVKVLDEPEQLIALVQKPRSEEELAELEEKPEEDVEGVEVEEKGKEEEEEEGETPAESESAPETPTEKQK